VNCQKLGNCYYFSLGEISNFLISDSEKLLINNSIRYKNEILKFSPNSFYIVYQNDSIVRVAQMAQTTFEKNGELFIPVISFFNAMNGINLINSTIDRNQIEIINKLIFKTNACSQPDNYIISTNIDGKLIDQNEILLLIEKDSLIIDKPEDTKFYIETRIIVKNTENKKRENGIPKYVKQSKLIDSNIVDDTGKDLFLYDTKKDEINPKSYTIPKNLKKPK
jgi:hypothetical protein